MADLLDLVLDGDTCPAGCDGPVALPSPAVAVCGTRPTRPFKSVSMKGKVGGGRFGSQKDRSILALHMRSQKKARGDHFRMQKVLSVLKGSTFSKGGKKFKVDAKETRGSGVIISLKKLGTRGNRFVRRIPFSHFLEASFGKNGTNVAVAARLDIDISTVPKVQKTCAQVAMCLQAKLLWMLLRHCTEHKPLTVIRRGRSVCVCGFRWLVVGFVAYASEYNVLELMHVMLTFC